MRWHVEEVSPRAARDLPDNTNRLRLPRLGDGDLEDAIVPIPGIRKQARHTLFSQPPSGLVDGQPSFGLPDWRPGSGVATRNKVGEKNDYHQLRTPLRPPRLKAVPLVFGPAARVAPRAGLEAGRFVGHFLLLLPVISPVATGANRWAGAKSGVPSLAARI